LAWTVLSPATSKQKSIWKVLDMEYETDMNIDMATQFSTALEELQRELSNAGRIKELRNLIVFLATNGEFNQVNLTDPNWSKVLTILAEAKEI
jgi:hypothetical protein